MELHNLAAKVNDATDVKESAGILVDGIVDLISRAGTDAESLSALRDSLAEQSDALAEAVAANTPGD